MLNGENIKASPTRSEKEQVYLLHPLVFNTRLEVPARTIRQENKRDTNRKQSKVFLCRGGMILYMTDPKHCSRTLSKMDSTFSKVTGYKINMPYLVAFLYTKEKQEKSGKQSYLQ